MDPVWQIDIGALGGELVRRKARVVAIDGCGGAGKSTLAARLAESVPRALVLAMDDFHRPRAERRTPGPAGFGGDYDRERLIAEVLDHVAAGRDGRYRRYDWDEDRLAEWHEVPADTVVILEGVYATSRQLRRFVDFAIWVACPRELRLARGVERDGEEGRKRWVERWMPAEDRYVEAERPDERADLIVRCG